MMRTCLPVDPGPGKRFTKTRGALEAADPGGLYVAEVGLKLKGWSLVV